MTNKKTTLLLILDGWGCAPPEDAASGVNAIRDAKTPNWDDLLKTRTHTHLKATGRAVGLPDGVMGNSEVGHLNIGAGRVVWQDITRIDRAIELDGLATREPIVAAI